MVLGCMFLATLPRQASEGWRRPGRPHEVDLQWRGKVSESARAKDAKASLLKRPPRFLMVLGGCLSRSSPPIPTSAGFSWARHSKDSLRDFLGLGTQGYSQPMRASQEGGQSSTQARLSRRASGVSAKTNPKLRTPNPKSLNSETLHSEPLETINPKPLDPKP